MSHHTNTTQHDIIPSHSHPPTHPLYIYISFSPTRYVTVRVHTSIEYRRPPPPAIHVCANLLFDDFIPPTHFPSIHPSFLSSRGISLCRCVVRSLCPLTRKTLLLTPFHFIHAPPCALSACRFCLCVRCFIHFLSVFLSVFPSLHVC